MAQTDEDQVTDILTDGLTNFGDAVGDRSWPIKQLSGLSRDIKDAVVENIEVGNTCKFAFPAMVTLPDIRTDCFFAILNDKVVVAWRKGLFKKTTICRVISKDTIKKASWAVSSRASTRGAVLLTIDADENTVIALPKGKPDVANAILAAVRAQ